MTNTLTLAKFGTYANGFMRYALNIENKEMFTEDEPIQIQIPKDIMLRTQNKRYLGRIKYEIPMQYSEVLELTRVFPLALAHDLKETGLGSLILSQTFLKFYKDSLNSREINPDTPLIINTKTPELITILKNRTFQREASGYMTTIQNAAEQSERILSKRN